MEFHSALAADALSVVFWALVVASVVFAFLWLDSLVEHLDLRKGWVRGGALVASILAAVYSNSKVEELRSISKGLEAGEATFMALWFLLSAALLVGPFILIFSSSSEKSPDKSTQPIQH